MASSNDKKKPPAVGWKLGRKKDEVSGSPSGSSSSSSPVVGGTSGGVAPLSSSSSSTSSSQGSASPSSPSISPGLQPHPPSTDRNSYSSSSGAHNINSSISNRMRVASAAAVLMPQHSSPSLTYHNNAQPTQLADKELIDAADTGDIDTFKALLNGHRDVTNYINLTDKFGASPLHLAANGGHHELCDYMIREGARVRCVNSDNTTPLHYLVRKAMPTQRDESTGSDFLAPSLPLSTLLSGPGPKSSYHLLLDLFLAQGADLNAQTSRGETPLHQASVRANPEAVRWLLANGANRDLKNTMGETPLECLLANSSHSNPLVVHSLQNAALRDAPRYRATPIASSANSNNMRGNSISGGVPWPGENIKGLMSWGYGPYGQLGYPVIMSAGSDRVQTLPREVETLTGKKLNSISCGSYISGAVLDNGDVVVWGRAKAPAQLNTGNCLLLGIGSEVDQTMPQPLSLSSAPPTPSSSTGAGSSSLSHHSSSSSSSSSSVSLTAFGSPVVQLSMGVYHSAIVLEDGRLLTWGYGGNGQLGHGNRENREVPTPVEFFIKHVRKFNIIAVACGDTHTVALNDEGQVYTFGENDHGQLGQGDVEEKMLPTMVAGLKHVRIVQIACAATHSACLSADGLVYTFGVTHSNSSTPHPHPTLVTALEDIHIKQISCGSFSIAALSDLGDLYTWGSGKLLGHGDVSTIQTPKLVEALRDISVRQVSCGSNHMVVVSDSGSLHSCGKDTFGQCGTGLKADQTTPTRVSIPYRACHVSCGENHTACIVDRAVSYDEQCLWTLLGMQRSFARSLNAIVQVYSKPLTNARAANQTAIANDKVVNSRHPSVPNSIFVMEDDLVAIFGSNFDYLVKHNSAFLAEVEHITRHRPGLSVPPPLLTSISASSTGSGSSAGSGGGGGSNSNSLHESSSTEDFIAEQQQQQQTIMSRRSGSPAKALVSRISDMIARYVTNEIMWKYFAGLARTLSTVDSIGDANPQIVVYLQDCKKIAETMRKSEVLHESDREMDLKSLLIEPFFHLSRLQHLMEDLLKNISTGSSSSSSSSGVFTGIGDVEDCVATIKRILHDFRLLASEAEDSTAQQSGAGMVNALGRAVENLAEFNRLSKKSVKMTRKINASEKALVDEQTAYADNMTKIKQTLEGDSKKGAPALVFDSYSDLLKRIGVLDSQAASRVATQFANPLGQLSQDIEDSMSELTPLKKEMESSYQDYVSLLSKLLSTAKGKDQKKVGEIEKEVQQRKKIFDNHASEVSTRLRILTQKKEKALTYYYASMKAQYDYFVVGLERMQQFKPQMDALDAYIKTQDRKEWAAQLHFTISHELASLPSELASDGDAQLVSFLLDLPPLQPSTATSATPSAATTSSSSSSSSSSFISSSSATAASHHGVQYQPLVDLLSAANLAALNSVVATCSTEEQEGIMRVAVRILDAFRKTLPLIKYSVYKEVDATTDPSTLFRSNNISTKLIGTFTKLTGLPYLQRYLQPHVVDLLNANASSFEVDPVKAREGENVEQNMTRVLEAAQNVLDTVIRSVNDVPLTLRVVCTFIAYEVGRKFPANRYNSIGGYFFLRFVCPAILSPSAYGLMEEVLSPDLSRPFILVSKVLQNLSNGIEFGGKEAYMVAANRFISKNTDKVRHFFDQLLLNPSDVGLDLSSSSPLASSSSSSSSISSGYSSPSLTPSSSLDYLDSASSTASTGMVLPPVPIQYTALATMDEVIAVDLRLFHSTTIRNLPKIVKSLAQYRNKDAVPKVARVLADLGDPSLLYK